MRREEKEKVSFNESSSKHFQAAGPSLAGRAVRPSWRAELGRPLAMTRSTAALWSAANGNEMDKMVFTSLLWQRSQHRAENFFNRLN